MTLRPLVWIAQRTALLFTKKEKNVSGVGFGGGEGFGRGSKRQGFDPCVGKIPYSRKWQPPPVFLPGKSHGQRSLVGYSPWGRQESDPTE